MTVYKCFFNYDKEEKWLEQMAKRGYYFEKVFFGYTFRSSEPEQATIKIDYRTFKNERDYLDYCSLFEDSGWKHIAGTISSGNQYFKKTADNGDDDIFSDSLSRAGRYKRISVMWLSLTITLFPIFIALSMTNVININNMINPKLLYFTPGLWEMNGFDFWRHFLFETPFALLRGYSWIIAILPVILYFIFAIKSWMLYKKDT